MIEPDGINLRGGGVLNMSEKVMVFYFSFPGAGSDVFLYSELVLIILFALKTLFLVLESRRANALNQILSVNT